MVSMWYSAIFYHVFLHSGCWYCQKNNIYNISPSATFDGKTNIEGLGEGNIKVVLHNFKFAHNFCSYYVLIILEPINVLKLINYQIYVKICLFPKSTFFSNTHDTNDYEHTRLQHFFLTYVCKVCTNFDKLCTR